MDKVMLMVVEVCEMVYMFEGFCEVLRYGLGFDDFV